ncbi:hypothetical protein [Blastopirellula retiformator]|uniref:Carboxypeptidase regulatory-like domain-containing protein n=1 Tax=Blastopirellula retiformator TaxID=2527970 RepID=A0A5C5UZG5_9BACT|nr:hypothetical protein [Blastopirellula retiformator]TWT30885.1 hypothetical protein Enr8_44110 [Blastopirellula retiformator]
MRFFNYAIWLLLAAAVGCGGSNSTSLPVAGVVNFKGAPVPRGSVTFTPNSTQGNSGPAVSADIFDGKFDTTKAKYGMTEGAYRVRIYGFDGNAMPEKEIPLGRAIFKEFHTEANITQENAGSLEFTVSK